MLFSFFFHPTFRDELLILIYDSALESSPSVCDVLSEEEETLPVRELKMKPPLFKVVEPSSS